MGRSTDLRVVGGVGILPRPPEREAPPSPGAPPSEREAWALLLAVDGLGPAGFGALLLAHGTALAVLEAARHSQAAGSLGRIAADAEGRPGAAGAIGRALV